MRSIISFSFIITAAFLMWACTPQPCFDETVSAVKGSFYITGSDKVQTADSITLYGIGMESSKLYNKTTNISNIELPLNPITLSSAFLIRTNGIDDTITFNYTSFPFLISKECGFTYYHTLESVSSTRNLIDTVIIRYPTITTGNEENIRIFY